jgi:hypothetical protein
MVLRSAILLIVWSVFGLTGFSDTLRFKDGRQISGFYEGGTSRIVRFRSDSGIQEFDIFSLAAIRIQGTSEKTRAGSVESISFFGPEQERLIRDWFSKQTNLRGLPPGLAKREKLPPGMERQLQRNGTLPPGLQKRLQPLPLTLERQLSPTGPGMARVVISGNVILLDQMTATILDLITDVY